MITEALSPVISAGNSSPKRFWAMSLTLQVPGARALEADAKPTDANPSVLPALVELVEDVHLVGIHPVPRQVQELQIVVGSGVDPSGAASVNNQEAHVPEEPVRVVDVDKALRLQCDASDGAGSLPADGELSPRLRSVRDLDAVRILGQQHGAVT